MTALTGSFLLGVFLSGVGGILVGMGTRASNPINAFASGIAAPAIAMALGQAPAKADEIQWLPNTNTQLVSLAETEHTVRSVKAVQLAQADNLPYPDFEPLPILDEMDLKNDLLDGGKLAIAVDVQKTPTSSIRDSVTSFIVTPKSVGAGVYNMLASGQWCQLSNNDVVQELALGWGNTNSEALISFLNANSDIDENIAITTEPLDQAKLDGKFKEIAQRISDEYAVWYAPLEPGKVKDFWVPTGTQSVLINAGNQIETADILPGEDGNAGIQIGLTGGSTFTDGVLRGLGFEIGADIEAVSALTTNYQGLNVAPAAVGLGNNCFTSAPY